MKSPASTSAPAIELKNTKPIDYKDKKSPYSALFPKMQGNILKGHGRDFAANIFVQFDVKETDLKAVLRELTEKYVTSAYRQLEESDQYSRFAIPGSLFGNLMLTAKAYVKLGLGMELPTWFDTKAENPNGAFPQQSHFPGGMLQAAGDLGDRVDAANREKLTPLECAYVDGTIDALLLLADDGEQHLLRTTREFITDFESRGLGRVVAVELGKALRNEDGEGIEHFGYVDGRSQPLFLASDFKNLDPATGAIDLNHTTEKVNDKAKVRESGKITFWNPFAPLDIVLLKDQAVSDPEAFGSYFVFRKLEQDVLRFSIAEQQLADELELEGADRERAGAMAVGRFRDGTPLVISEVDGVVPAKDNNFRYDGLDASLAKDPAAPQDRLGQRCPFHAHIRKTNPRQSENSTTDTAEEIQGAENDDLSRRIVRRGIPFGERREHPSTFQTLDDLPTGGVGLLFACFQSSIIKQFAFMQKTWANNTQFKVPLGTNPALAPTGIDPLIGQPLDATPAANPPHQWRQEYGGSADERTNPASVVEVSLAATHPTEFNFSNFVKFRGGEFFFAPSIPFLLGK